jgi:hypothetical protein
MTEHTPVQAVTVPKLLESHAALERLLLSTEDRIRDELAKQYGVAIEDRVEFAAFRYGGKIMRVWVVSIAVLIREGAATLIVSGTVNKGASTQHAFPWNPATCTVVKKGEPG